MHFFSLLYIFFFSVVAASDLNIRSIIVLENNVPSECGLSFETADIVSKVTIKKIRMAHRQFLMFNQKMKF